MALNSHEVILLQVRADLRAVSFTLDPKEKKMIQRETLAALFETYFRILKHSMNTSRYVPCVSEFMCRKDLYMVLYVLICCFSYSIILHS